MLYATIVAIVLSGILLAYLVAEHMLVTQRTLDKARIHARQVSDEQAKKINDRLISIEPVAESIAADLSAGRLKSADIPTRIRTDLLADKDVSEIGVIYAPFAKDASTRLFAPSVTMGANGTEAFQLESRVDYPAQAWYDEAMKAGKPQWSDPHLSAATKAVVVAFTAPFYKAGDRSRPIGFVRTNLSLDVINRMLSSLSLGETGYGLIMSRTATFIAHPRTEFVRQQKTMFDIAKQFDDPQRRRMAELVTQGKPYETNSISHITNQETWLLTRPIPEARWMLGATFIRDEFLPEPKELRRSLARVACAAMLFLFFASMVLFRGWRGGPHLLWNVTIAMTVLFTSGIGFMWWLTLRYPDHNGETAVHIGDQAHLENFLASRAQAAPQQAPPLQIPTGLYVRTLNFGTGNDVSVTGMVWQRLPIDTTAGAKSAAGVRFIDAEDMSMSESYRARQGNVDVVGWDFKGTISEQFEGAIKYPFDRALIRLRIAPQDVSANVMLTPDLYSYTLLTPGEKPGVEKNIQLPGWDLDRGYFNYSSTSYNTTFGVPALAGRDRSYELGYTIVAVRRFLDPFIQSVLPMLVVACLLFGLLIVGSRETEKIAATGFNSTNVLLAAISLLFPVVVAEVNIRSKVLSNTIIYIEYFYFVLYVAILGVAANALQFTLGRHTIVHVRDNLIPKLVYWPFITGACFAVTMAFLY